MEEIETDRFDARADDGTAYTIIELTVMVPVASTSGDRSSVPGTKRFVLLGRKADIRRINESTFEIIDTKQILRKIG